MSDLSHADRSVVCFCIIFVLVFLAVLPSKEESSTIKSGMEKQLQTMYCLCEYVPYVGYLCMLCAFVHVYSEYSGSSMLQVYSAPTGGRGIGM